MEIADLLENNQKKIAFMVLEVMGENEDNKK